MLKFKKIIYLIFIILFITGCSCSREDKINEEENKNITDITLEIPMNDVYKLEIKTGENEKAYIKIGDSFKIITWITPKNAENKEINWIISNPDIIKITKDGTVTGIKSGKTDIKAYNVNENNINSNTITVEVLEG